jgi:N-acetylmuramoyl-L-alanine amidase
MGSTKLHRRGRSALRSCLLAACMLVPLTIARAQNSSQTSFVIALDPAHGGADSGAHLGDGAAEKDMTLALAKHLRTLLEERGFTVITTRSTDADLSNDARAAIANRAHAQACILLHTTATGNGVHLFTTSLAPADDNAAKKSFVPWQSAQAAFVTRSIALTAQLNAAFAALTGRDAIPVTVGKTYLAPMDNLTCPAVTVEVAPLTLKDSHAKHEADDSTYEQRVASTIAWSLQQWRASVTGEPVHDDSLNPAHAGSIH